MKNKFTFPKTSLFGHHSRLCLCQFEEQSLLFILHDNFFTSHFLKSQKSWKKIMSDHYTHKQSSPFAATQFGDWSAHASQTGSDCVAFRLSRVRSVPPQRRIQIRFDRKPCLDILRLILSCGDLLYLNFLNKQHYKIFQDMNINVSCHFKHSELLEEDWTENWT